MATSAATLPLRRRLIGSLVVLAGALAVLVGFFVTLTPNATSVGGAPASKTVIVEGYALSLTSSSGTAADALRHLTDHALASGTNVQTIADLAFRIGVVAMAGAAIASVLLLVGPARGMIGLMAGVGFLGLALCTAVATGESAALSTVNGGSLHIDLGTAVVVIGLGFVVILAGGAVAAFRPLAGLFSGLGLLALSVVVGIVLALVVGGDHLATQTSPRQGGSSLVSRPGL